MSTSLKYIQLAFVLLATMPAALCQDAQFVKTRLERLALFAPPFEVDNFKRACGR